MAYGVSVLFICQVHCDSSAVLDGNERYAVVSPRQNKSLKSIGSLNAERAGLGD